MGASAARHADVLKTSVTSSKSRALSLRNFKSI